MYFDNGSYSNFGGSIELEDDFVQDDLNDDDQQEVGGGLEALQSLFNFTNSDQQDLSNLKDPYETQSKPSTDNYQAPLNSFFGLSSHEPNSRTNLYSSTDPTNLDLSIDSSNRFSSSIDSSNDHSIFSSSLESSSLYSSRYNSRNFSQIIIGDCCNGPPKLPNFQMPDILNSSSLSISSYFNKGNAASAVPAGINGDQYVVTGNFIISHDVDGSSDFSKSSISNLKEKNLSNVMLKERFDSGGELAFRRCPIYLADQFDKYLKIMVLPNQKKVGKDLKIIIFNFFREYLRSFRPELKYELRPLSRDEKRNIKLIDKRLFEIKEYIVYHFENNKEETLIPIVEKYNQFVLMNHKRKGTKAAKKNLAKINSMKSKKKK